MRTRTIEVIIDRAFWALVLCLPVFAYLILCIHHDSFSFIDLMSQFNVTDSNVIYTTLVSMFGSGGYLEFVDTTTTNPMLLYMSYFFVIELIHIVVDLLLFIPKVCVEIIDKYSSVGKI